MINPQDLRIGNKLDFEGEVFTITSIDGQGVGVTNDQEETWIDLWQMSPIPLTIDWLAQLGFERSSNGLYWTYYHDIKVDFNGNHQTRDDYMTIEDDDGLWALYLHQEFLRHVEHVHEVQNIYHSLTGEELETNN